MSIDTSFDVVMVTQEQKTATPGIITDNMTFQSFRHLDIFLKTQPKALGTVQIMIGIMTILLGCVMAFNTYTYTCAVLTWIVFWGPIIFIIAGSLTIAAENKLNPCLVKGSLGMNVISAVTAGFGNFFLIVDVIFNAGLKWSEYNWHYVLGISGVLLVFFLLQLIISICLSAFACKATTRCDHQAFQDFVNMNMKILSAQGNRQK